MKAIKYIAVLLISFLISCDGIIKGYYEDVAYAWTMTFGGVGYDTVSSSPTFDLAGNIYLTGHFWYQADFDPGPDIDIKTSAGRSDCFLVKIKREIFIF